MSDIEVDLPEAFVLDSEGTFQDPKGCPSQHQIIERVTDIIFGRHRDPTKLSETKWDLGTATGFLATFESADGEGYKLTIRYPDPFSPPEHSECVKKVIEQAISALFSNVRT